jgi:hypothetical protein
MVFSNHKIPVIGLYAQYANSVQVVFKDETGAEVSIKHSLLARKIRYMIHLSSSTSILNKQILHYLHSVWGNSWLMESTGRGYDQNGDLRFNFLSVYHLQPLRTTMVTSILSDEDMSWYGRRFFKIDILGNVIFEFDMRDSDGNHYSNTHDLVWDSAGDIYMFGNDSPNRITNTMGQDGARFLTIRPGK